MDRLSGTAPLPPLECMPWQVASRDMSVLCLESPGEGLALTSAGAPQQDPKGGTPGTPTSTLARARDIK